MTAIAELPTPALPLDAYDEASRQGVARLMWAIAAFMGALLLIAALAPIHKVAVADGQVTPVGTLVRVSHPEGGVVDRLLVRAGQEVKAGDLLAVLKPVGAQSDLAQVESRRLSLELARERLQSLLDERAPRFTAGSENAQRVSEQQDLFRAESETARMATAGLDARIAQRKAEIQAFESEIAAGRSQLALQMEQVSLREGLFKDGYATRASLLEAKLAAEQTQGRIAGLSSQVMGARSALLQVQSERAEALADRRRAWSAELTKVTGELAELSATETKASDRLASMELRAPIAGVVQEMGPKAAGEVIPPGQPAITIVPVDAPLFAEARVRPEDLGEVAVGYKARVSISAFDPELYGNIEGVVSAISPTTFETERGERYYRVTITLSRTSLERKGEAHKLLPGMGVRAEIITGERSLLQHLTKPIDRALERAFHQ
jgi:HlyD family secretion protein/adhesin transport system membrane fusion protein